MVPNECHSIGANASTDSRFFDNSSSAASRVSELNEESYLPKELRISHCFYIFESLLIFETIKTGELFSFKIYGNFPVFLIRFEKRHVTFIKFVCMNSHHVQRSWK